MTKIPGTHQPKLHRKIMTKGSRTYSTASFFFPESVKRDVQCLYSFVRVADDYVDAVPQQKAEFERFRDHYYAALQGEAVDDDIISPFVELSRRYNFDPAWTEAFFRSMEWDIEPTSYSTIDELLAYIYGSAEVIGLFMSRIVGLPSEADNAAIQQGRAMQLINFIRDIHEDHQLGRRYLPTMETDLPDLSESSAHRQPDEFKRYIRFQIDRFLQWQDAAEQGFSYIPYRYRIPIAAAADMYAWTAHSIYQDPFIVYKQKVKPSKIRIFSAIMRRALLLSNGIHYTQRR